MSAQQGVTAFLWTTPNGWKVSIALEELGIPYKVHGVDLSKNEQKEPAFLKVNPNGKIPAIVDHDNGDFPVFESGAILVYLAEKVGDGRLLPKDSKGRSEVLQWLFFQMSAIGPIFGQLSHFVHAAPEKVPYALKRFTDEAKRIIDLLEAHLQGREYLAGEYSIADIATFPWLFSLRRNGFGYTQFPNIHAYIKRIWSRPAVQRGLDIPNPNPTGRQLVDPNNPDPEPKA